MRPLAAVLALFLLLPAAAAMARQPGRARPLDQILPAIRHAHPGTFYDAEGPFAGADGRLHYRLKWLTPSGRVVWLDADAESGAVLGESFGGLRREQSRDERRYAPRDERRDERRDRRRDPRHHWP